MAFISVRSLLGTKSQQQKTNKQAKKKSKSLPVYQEFPAENFKDK